MNVPLHPVLTVAIESFENLLYKCVDNLVYVGVKYYRLCSLIYSVPHL